MVSENDHPVESFFNPIEAVKGVFSPLESGIRKAAKDIEDRWSGPRNRGDDVEFISRLNGGGGCSERAGKFHASSSFSSVLRKKNGKSGVGEERKKGSFIKIPLKNFVGMFWQNSGSGEGVDVRKDVKERDVDGDGNGCATCLQFTVHWSLLANSVVQALPVPFKPSKKRVHRQCSSEDRVRMNTRASCNSKKKEMGNPSTIDVNKGNVHFGEEKYDALESLECFLGFLCDQLSQNLQKLDAGMWQESKNANQDSLPPQSPQSHFDHFKAMTSIWEVRKAEVNGFLGNLKFARVGGVPSSIIGVTSPVKDEGDDAVGASNREESSAGHSPQKMASGILSIPLSNVERLKSTLSTVSLTELMELVPQLGRPSKEHPDKKKLFSVQDFFRYTESEGRRFFEELDRDGDGQVTLEDLEVAMRKRKLPQGYAWEFMHRTRSHLFSKSFGWRQFLSLMEQREPTILRAYTSLCLSKSGTLQKSEVLSSLKNAGLPANEDNAIAMMRFLDADKEGSISYGHFRNFMLLLPSDRLQDDPRNVWFEAATVVAVAPPVEIPAGNVLRSALAGGLSCALSTSLMHPVDTIKTRVQASTLSFPDIIAKLPQIGVRGLYRGSVPAIVGQFSSHGLRTGIFEASKLILINVAPNLPDIQVQSLASFCSTFLGTAVRIPCEVLKQRLQAGLFDNVGEAIGGTWQQDGLKGFFRGTGATLCREVPFYVAGMGLYAESKKLAQHLLGRELEAWETIAVGALSGGLAAVVTTPFDVMKTRMMTAPQGRPVSMSLVAFSILRHEGPLGLFKGAVPRFFWIAPLGAMNFAGYELARKAMTKGEESFPDQLSQSKETNSG